MSVVVTTYNIHRCIGLDGNQDMDRIVSVLGEIDSDIIALQEVESHGRNRDNMLDYLADNTGFYPVAGPTMLSGAFYYGNGLLSRFPPQQNKLHDISYKNHEPRGAIEAYFQTGDNKIRIITTHLGLKPIERRNQIKKLLKIIDNVKTDTKMTTILMGDINEWFLWGRPLRWMQHYFGHAPAVRSFPSNMPLLALDRIWCHPNEKLVTVRTHKSDLSRIASDHLPLMAEIQL